MQEWTQSVRNQNRAKPHKRGDWSLKISTVPRDSRRESFADVFNRVNATAFTVMDNLCEPDIRAGDIAIVDHTPGLYPRVNEYAMIKIGQFPKVIRKAVMGHDDKMSFEVCRSEAGLKYEIYGVVIATVRRLR